MCLSAEGINQLLCITNLKHTNCSLSSHSYQFPKGVNTIHIEIYDERTLTDDELIAWVNLPIPETIFQVCEETHG